MANIKSAKKRVLIAERNRQRNVAFKTSIKTALKKVLELAKAEDKEALNAAISKAYQLCDKAVSKGVLHKNTAARKKSRLTKAVNKLRVSISHAHKIEVECDTIEQVKEAVSVKADIIMLDNMSVEQMKQAVDIINHQAIVEASGNVKLDTVNAIASTGVDIISSSAIVAKAPTLDLALDM